MHILFACAGSYVTRWSAIGIGCIGGLVYQLSSKRLLMLKIDDVVGAIPVHGACGLWGLMATALFVHENYYEDNFAEGKWCVHLYVFNVASDCFEILVRLE